MIANRGEIAVRIIRTCQDMGIATVAVYSHVDRDALHVKLADEAYDIGPAEALQSYLDMWKILDAAERCGADAIHPGYGFLSENPEFAEMTESRGFSFIGPSSECMSRAKPKNRARQLMKMINIPVTPGCDEAITDTGIKGLNQGQGDRSRDRLSRCRQAFGCGRGNRHHDRQGSKKNSTEGSKVRRKGPAGPSGFPASI